MRALRNFAITSIVVLAFCAGAFGNIYYQWTPNPILGGLIGCAFVYLLICVVHWARLLMGKPGISPDLFKD